MIGLSMLILAIATGCGRSLVGIVLVDIPRAMAPTVRAHPQLQEKLASIKIVAIMPPGVTIYQRGVGATQVMEEETATARRTLGSAVERELGHDAGVVFTPLHTPSAGLDAGGDPAAARLTAELKDTQALFEAVSASILLHTYYHNEGALSDWRFTEKLTNFDYSLGADVHHFATLAKADALLFTTGVDHISTGGRTAALIGGALALCLMTAPIGGGGCSALNTDLIAPPGTTALSVALVDGRTGALLWYNAAGFQGGAHSLTDAYSVSNLTVQVLNRFPLGTRPAPKDQDQNAWPISLGPR